MLVVVAIVGVLAAMLLPAVQTAREASRRTKCAGNLRQIGLAMQNYASANGGFPPRRVMTTGQICGWGAVILPFVEGTNVAKIYDRNANFYDTVNATAIGTPMEIYSCPSTESARRMTVCSTNGNTTSTGIAGDYFTANGVTVWWGTNTTGYSTTPLGDNDNTSFSQITDGLSSTLLVTEQGGRPDLYIRGVRQRLTVSTPNSAKATVNDVTVSQDQHGFWGCWASYQSALFITYTDDGLTQNGNATINANNSRGIYAFHTRGANAVFCDGAVHFLAEGMTPKVFAAIITARGGETPDDELRAAERLGGTEF
jgi:prepilin-type processing-associated H-X9-DG protein